MTETTISKATTTDNTTTTNTTDQEEYWLTSKIEDELYLEMCRKETADSNSRYGDPIKKYYRRAAKYAGRISAGNFSDGNIPRPVMEINLSDFTPRLVAELAQLRKQDMPMFRHVIKTVLSRMFSSRHPMIFHEHIEPNGICWEVKE